MSLAKLKAQVSTQIDKIKETKAPQKGAGGGNKDETYWAPTFDKEQGTGSAVIRFLPAPEGEDLPFVKLTRYAFKGQETGKWYIETSLNSVPGCWDDPVGKLVGRLLKTGLASDKAALKLLNRRVTFVANVLVVKDPAHPENNGKVFRFKYGPQIQGMLEAAMYPEFDDIPAIDPFNPWTGADFTIRMTGKNLPNANGKIETVPTYDKSSFGTSKPIGTDEYIEAVWGQTHSVKKVLEDALKPASELTQRLLSVLGPTFGSVNTVEGMELPEEKPVEKAAKPKAESKAPWGDDSLEDVPDFPVKEEKPKPKASGDDDLDFLSTLLDD